MARTGNNYENGYGEITLGTKQGMSIVLGFCPSSHCHLSTCIYQVWFKWQQ